MKVSDMSNLPQAHELNPHSRDVKSKYSLKFLNVEHEIGYQEAVGSTLPESFGINIHENIKSYMVTFYIIILLYDSSYLSNYLEENSSLNIVLFQCILLTSISVFTSLILFAFFIKKQASHYKNLLLVLSYTISLLVIVLNCYFVFSKIFPSRPPTGFNSILAIVPLFYTSKFTIFNSFLHYLIVNLLISFFYLILALISSEDTQRSLINFFLMTFVVLIESRSFYNQEKIIRDKYISIHHIIKSTPKKNQDSTPRTDIEEIIRNLKDSIQLVPLLAQTKERQASYAEKIFENLTKALTLLGNRGSVYSIDLEGLDNNLDNEDKIFIEETCIQPRLSIARNTNKCVIRKTIDVLRSYEIKDLIGILKRIGKEWNFDMFFLKDCTKNRPLVTVGSFCMQRYRLDSLFNIDLDLYQAFFSSLEELYKPNPYHNSAHAADVLCSFLYLVNQSRFNDYIQDYEILAGIIAMLGHDVAHPGVTNRFLINTKHPLSFTCNL